jgi:F0F1-type ATP synthase membrane subunit a
MMAGHTLIQILSGFVLALGGIVGLFSYFAVLPFLLVFAVTLLEVAIALIQAYVFTVLLCIYLNDSLNLH